MAKRRKSKGNGLLPILAIGVAIYFITKKDKTTTTLPVIVDPIPQIPDVVPAAPVKSALRAVYTY